MKNNKHDNKGNKMGFVEKNLKILKIITRIVTENSMLAVMFFALGIFNGQTIRQMGYTNSTTIFLVTFLSTYGTVALIRFILKIGMEKSYKKWFFIYAIINGTSMYISDCIAISDRSVIIITAGLMLVVFTTKFALGVVSINSMAEEIRNSKNKR